MRVPKRVLSALMLLSVWTVPCLSPAAEEEIVELRDSVADLLKVLIDKEVLSSDRAEDLVVNTLGGEMPERRDPAGKPVPRPANLVAELRQMREERDTINRELAEQKEMIRKLSEGTELELARVRSQKRLEQKVASEVKKVMRDQKPERSDSVRVRYIPEFLLAEIREQVKVELKEEVAQEIVEGVYDEQTEEGLPIPEVPEWVNSIKMKGDVRLRVQREVPADNSGRWIDYQAVNEKGKDINTAITSGAEDINEILLNPGNNEERDRSRIRLRLDAEAQFGYSMKAGARLSTGNTNDPVSTNQTLGTGNNKYSLVLDRAYLKYGWTSDRGNLKLSVTGGRMSNPWFSTDLLWDSDLGFEGLAGSLAFNQNRAQSLAGLTLREYRLRGTLGLFSLEEISSSSRDKWLFGGQLEGRARFLNMNQVRLGIGYYEYRNITGEARTTLYSGRDVATDATVPEYMQKGNTLFDVYPDTLAFTPGDNVDRFGLASDFKILNLIASVELLNLDPTRFWFTADYVKNLGWDEAKVQNRVGGLQSPTNPLSGGHDTGYLVKVEAGSKDMYKPGSWRAFMGYRYLEPDAVLDAFTDSDFHFGGTNSKGWFLGGKYIIEDNVYIGLRYLSAKEVMAPNDPSDVFGLLGTSSGSLSVDTLQIDIGGSF